VYSQWTNTDRSDASSAEVGQMTVGHLMFEHLGMTIRPTQLNSRSQAADAGGGMLVQWLEFSGQSWPLSYIFYALWDIIGPDMSSATGC